MLSSCCPLTSLLPRHQSRRSVAAHARARRASATKDGADDVSSLADFEASRGAGALLGWQVVLHEDGTLVGTVSEVLSASGGSFTLEVSAGAAAAPLPDEADPFSAFLSSLDDGGGSGDGEGEGGGAPENRLLRVACVGPDYSWSLYIPLASAIVPQLRPRARQLRITPPSGLLELGERPALLAWLDEELAPYLRGARAEPAAFSTFAARAAAPPRMPTPSELFSLGRFDLADAVERAGGYAAVALELRLRGARKPSGYWDDLEMVALGLREFADAAWSEHREPLPREAGEDEEGRSYWYNDITGEVRWESPYEEEEEGARVTMPPLSALAAARRWDLYNAVRLHGGQRRVALSLGWEQARRGQARGIRSLADLMEGIKEATEALSEFEPIQPGMMPTGPQLVAADREDVAAAIVAMGGPTAVATRLGLLTQKSGRGRWTQPERAAAELRDHLRSTGAAADGAGAKEKGRLPSQGALLAAGRPDLAYALQRHGAAPLAARLRLRTGRWRGGWRGFEEAREVARALRLGGQREWQAWCRGEGRPVDVPSDPYRAYREKGWAGWADWLGLLC